MVWWFMVSSTTLVGSARALRSKPWTSRFVTPVRKETLHAAHGASAFNSTVLYGKGRTSANARRSSTPKASESLVCVLFFAQRQGVLVVRKRLRDGARRVPALVDACRVVRQRRGVDHAPDRWKNSTGELTDSAAASAAPSAAGRQRKRDAEVPPHSSAICLAVAD